MNIFSRAFVRFLIVALSLFAAGCATRPHDTITVGEQTRLWAPQLRIDKVRIPAAGADGTFNELLLVQLQYRTDAAGTLYQFHDAQGNRIGDTLRFHMTKDTVPALRAMLETLAPSAAVAGIQSFTAYHIAKKNREACGSNGCPGNSGGVMKNDVLVNNDVFVEVSLGCLATGNCPATPAKK